MFPKNKIDKIFFTAAVFLALLTLLTNAYAHAEEKEFRLDESIASASINYTLAASAIISILVLISIFYKQKTEAMKWALFILILIPIIFTTAYIAGSTIYLNLISETKGPVHWHADFEIWNCGKQVDVIDPTDLANRVGSPVLHEHGDNRIHIEGVVVKKSDFDLHSFFEQIGSLTAIRAVVRTQHGFAEMKNGDLCNRKEGKLQVFLYRIINADETRKTGFVYEQVKLVDFEEYVISPYSLVPPGDCLIIEFDGEKNETKKMCGTYEIAINKGDMRRAG